MLYIYIYKPRLIIKKLKRIHTKRRVLNIRNIKFYFYNRLPYVIKLYKKIGKKEFQPPVVVFVLVSMAVKHNNVLLNLITGCLY